MHLPCQIRDALPSVAASRRARERSAWRRWYKRPGGISGAPQPVIVRTGLRHAAAVLALSA